MNINNNMIVMMIMMMRKVYIVSEVVYAETVFIEVTTMTIFANNRILRYLELFFAMFVGGDQR